MPAETGCFWQFPGLRSVNRLLRGWRHAMTETALEPKTQHDMARRPVSAFLWWCLPIVIGIVSGSLGLTLRENAAVWAVAFVWMAAGCFLNALRCHRLLCYFSG